VLLLAHHQHDQAETLLLRLLRGSGVRGLSAMSDVGIVPYQTLTIPCWRPLLTINRTEIAAYAQQQALTWVEDDSNNNIAFNRNYIRHQVLPVLQQRWPSVSQQLADTSQRMREADELLHDLAVIDFQHAQLAENTLNIDVLAQLSVARRNNLLRYWLQQQQLALPDYADLMRVWSEVCLAQADAEPLLAWRGVEIRRYKNQLFAMLPLVTFNHQLEVPWLDKSQALLLPNQQLLSPQQAFLGVEENAWQTGQVSIRFRQGGEKIRPVGRQHHHDLKKLLQAKGVPTWQRHAIPLLYINQQLAAVLGYWIAHDFAAQ
jgi:tRNA(Ile)-lysidine synthase